MMANVRVLNRHFKNRHFTISLPKHGFHIYLGSLKSFFSAVIKGKMWIKKGIW
jgi:hypothetical protein